jgi:hypothetical protein
MVRKKDSAVTRKSDEYHMLSMRSLLVRHCGKVEQESIRNEANRETQGLKQSSERDESKRFSHNNGEESPK